MFSPTFSSTPQEKFENDVYCILKTSFKKNLGENTKNNTVSIKLLAQVLIWCVNWPDQKAYQLLKVNKVQFAAW